MIESLLKEHGIKSANDVIILCVGTDRSTGDALGPLVGSQLKEKGYKVYGTLDEPVHAMNLVETIENLPQGKKVIAIDACLGQLMSVGNVKAYNGPLKPGAGVNKELPEVGDIALTGIVNVGGFMEYFVLQNTRLSVVMKMAQEIAATIEQNIPLGGIA